MISAIENWRDRAGCGQPLPGKARMGYNARADGDRPLVGHELKASALISILTRQTMMRNGQTPSPRDDGFAMEKSLSERASRRVFGVFFSKALGRAFIMGHPAARLSFLSRLQDSSNHREGESRTAS